MLPGHILFVVNSDAFFVSHRLALGRALVEHGYRVTVAAGETGGRAAIEAAGIRALAVPFDRGGRSPTRDARTLARLVALYRRERPSLAHHVTIKPVIYGSIAARAAGVPAVVNAISGLGFVFIDRDRRGLSSASHGALRAGVTAAYRIALGNPRARTIFQNPDDLAMFVSRGLVVSERAELIPGSGVDTSRFRPSPLPSADGREPLVILPARMLWDKGVGEFVTAARALRASGLRARFALVGAADDTNPAAVSRAQLEAWRAEGVVEVWGHRGSMEDVYRSADLVALPSYREGLPLALAEAAASGRACVASDVPGCREVVHHGDNGWLVAARNVDALETAMREALTSPAELVRRGARGPARIANGFSLSSVLARHFALYEQLLGEAPRLQRPLHRRILEAPSPWHPVEGNVSAARTHEPISAPNGPLAA